MQIFLDKIKKPRNRKPRKTRDYCITINNKLVFLDFAIECGMADQHEFYVCEIGEP